jgi:hypothetical protein
MILLLLIIVLATTLCTGLPALFEYTSVHTSYIIPIGVVDSAYYIVLGKQGRGLWSVFLY